MTNCRVRVRVTPRGGADRIDAVERDESGRALVRLRVRAAPADGQANAAVGVTLAKALGLSKSKVTLVSGATSRIKILEIEGLDEAEVMARLLA
ncbi:DUF167 family protein [Brevundimonas aveniformis]|uniref:DUF167 family protein n=1 Tax=Brevundimonas aveniformis TaxID=370977 RepID=UPI00042010CA|nr:DUF167 family protein [Brevundimonas aveniformis]